MAISTVLPHSSLTGFEKVFQESLEKKKPDGHGGYVVRGHPDYQVRLEGGDIRQGLPLGMSLIGPIYRPQGGGRSGSDGYVGRYDTLRARFDASGYNNETKRHAESVWWAFVHDNAEVPPDLLPYDISAYDAGWGYFFRRNLKDPHGPKKELAIYAAEMPGRGIALYTPSGSRVLSYDERRKIPTGLVNTATEIVARQGIYQALLKIWERHQRPKSGVSAWQIGPGEKYFKGKLGARHQ